MAIEVKLPELGDGIESADVLEVLVREGEQIQKDQGIIEVETDKATVQIPSSQGGVVAKIHVRSGDKISIGSTLITLDAKSGASGKDGAEAKSTAASGKEAPAKSASEAPAKDAEPKVSPARTAAQQDEPPEEPHPETLEETKGSTRADASGAKPAAKANATASARPRAEGSKPPRATNDKPAATAAAAEQEDEGEVDQEREYEAGEPAGRDADGSSIAAGPAVRRFAREVGVDLRRVRGTGPGGRITREDVLEVVRQASQVAQGTATSTPGASRDAWGNVRIERLSKIRKTIAAKMHQSWSTVPRVTNFDDADVTELERIRLSSKADYASKGIKLTALPFLIKAVAMALKNHPMVNASLDLDNEQIIFKEYVHIGIAVDSEKGLVVPVLRNADAKSIPDIARSVAQLAEKVRTNDYGIDDLRGGSFTISNLGAVGGTYSTPIVNVPEVGILLVGRSRKMPVVVDDDKMAVRLMMPLSLSYDHRLVDGAAAARFLNDVIAFLEAPSRLLLAP